MKYSEKNSEKETTHFFKIWRVCLCLMGLACAGSLAGCGALSSFDSPAAKPVSPVEIREGQTDAPKDPAAPREGALSGTDGQAGSAGGTFSGRLFDGSSFAGSVTSVLYAGAGKLLVCADSLSLYDAAVDKIVGEYTFSQPDVSIWGIYPLSGGYALFGEFPESSAGGSSDVPEGEGGDTMYVQGSAATGLTATAGNEEGLRCWIFDEQFVLQDSLDLHRLLKEQGYEETELSAAISWDGTQIAVCGIRRTYLYQVEDNVFQVLLDMDSGRQSGSLRYVQASKVHFMGRGSGPEEILFTGIAIPEGKTDSVPVYGVMKSDGSALECYALSDYVLSGDMIPYQEEVFFPEDFQNATGRLLVTDLSGHRLRVVELEGEDTGEDGVFGSDTGKYVATAAILGDIDQWEGGWRVRIYDAGSGEIVWEQDVGTDKEAYEGLGCSVKILDELRECIVICGRGQERVITSYFF